MKKNNILLTFFAIFSATTTSSAIASETYNDLINKKMAETLATHAKQRNLVLELSLYSIIGGKKNEIENKQIHIGKKSTNENFLFDESNFSVLKYVADANSVYYKGNPVSDNKTNYIKKNVDYKEVLRGTGFNISGYFYDEQHIMSRIHTESEFFFCSKKKYSDDNQTLIESPDVNHHSSLLKTINKIDTVYKYKMQHGVKCSELPIEQESSLDGVYIEINYRIGE